MVRSKFEEVGKRIKTARKALHLQQKDLADALGISASHLSEIESGKANGSTELHLRLSDLYNISTEYIFHGRGEMFYDDDGKLTEEPFDFKSDVDNLPDLLWLLKYSGYVRVAVMTFVSKLLLNEEEEIKRSIKKTKPGPE